MEQKKIIEWLNLIEDSDIRSKAIENCTNGEKVAGSIKEAVRCAFIWRSTTQGDMYWLGVYESDIKLLKNTMGKNAKALYRALQNFLHKLTKNL